MSDEELTGRELDIAIVERVMDWLPPGDPATKAMRSRLRLTHPSYNDHYLTPEGELRKPPYYAVDAAAAMEILDRADGMWELTRCVEREVLDDDSTPLVLRYRCSLRFGDNLGDASGCATALEAIRQAALAARAVTDDSTGTENGDAGHQVSGL